MNQALQGLTWAVVDGKGQPVTTLETLAAEMGVEAKDAASLLLDSPFAECAPAELLDEAREVKAATPPAISTGSFVSWKGGSGRVDMVVTSGTVPGLGADAEAVEGSTDSPAARVVVYEKDGDNWKATGRKVGAKVATLKRIPPLPGSAASKSLAQQMAELRDDFAEQAEAKGLPMPTETATLAVYERGVKAWPGITVAGMGPREWAMGRVHAFCMKALGEPLNEYTRDDDLLPQPKVSEPQTKSTPADEPGGDAGKPGGDQVPPPTTDEPTTAEPDKAEEKAFTPADLERQLAALTI